MERWFGGNPLLVVLRLVVISVIVGIILAALGILPQDLFNNLRLLIQRVSGMGLDAVAWAWRYFLLGAVIVFPIWLIIRFFGLIGGAKRPRKRDGKGA